MHQLQSIRVSKKTDDDDQPCNGLMNLAEREFAAFTRAVTELFGTEQARLSAKDWLDELVSRDSLPGPRNCEWQLVTVAALARLTIRMTIELQYAGYGDAVSRWTQGSRLTV